MPEWLFVLLWFLVQEVLVQHAKYMWNDIRDHERDQKIPANCFRPIIQHRLTTNTTIVMAGRWIFGLVLAWLLSPVLLTVVLLISSLQIVYELAAGVCGKCRCRLEMLCGSSCIRLCSG